MRIGMYWRLLFTVVVSAHTAALAQSPIAIPLFNAESLLVGDFIVQGVPEPLGGCKYPEFHIRYNASTASGKTRRIRLQNDLSCRLIVERNDESSLSLGLFEVASHSHYRSLILQRSAAWFGSLLIKRPNMASSPSLVWR